MFCKGFFFWIGRGEGEEAEGFELKRFCLRMVIFPMWYLHLVPKWLAEHLALLVEQEPELLDLH